MNRTKLKLMTVLMLILPVLLRTPIQASAQTVQLVEDWPVSGVYQAVTEESEVAEYYFQEDMQVVVTQINTELDSTPLLYTTFVIVNQKDYDVSTYESQHMTQGVFVQGLMEQYSPDLKAIYSEVAELISPDTLLEEAELLVNFREAGYHMLAPYGVGRNIATAYSLTQPMIDTEDEVLYHWRVFGYPVFSIEVEEDGAAFVDAQGNRFERIADDWPEMDSVMMGEY